MEEDFLNLELDTEEIMSSDIESEKDLKATQEYFSTSKANEASTLAAQEQLMREYEDPRNKEGGGGFRGAMKELRSAIRGGVQDTASSIWTLPERTIDMFSGEMVEEQQTEEGYDAESDNWFVDKNNPIETKTWWGGALRSLVHFGSLAAAIIPAAKVMGVTAATTAVGSLVRGAAIGGVSDIVSKYSQEENGLAILRDRFNFIDTPLATKDVDHPAMKTLKNVVEGMGIGVVFDAASIVIGKGIKRLKPDSPPVKKGVGPTVPPEVKAVQLPDNLKPKKIQSTKEFKIGGVLVNIKDETTGKIITPEFEDDISYAIWKATEGTQKSKKPYRDWLKGLGIKGHLKKYRDRYEQQIKAFNEGAGLPNQYNLNEKLILRIPDELVQDGSIEATSKALVREQNVNNQIVEKARESIKYNEGYDPYKNKNISSSYQASPTSTGTAGDVYQQLKRTRKELGAEIGSTDSLHTPVQLQRTAISSEMAEGEVARVLEDFMSDARIQQEIASAKAQGKTLAEIWGDSAEMAKRIFEGRNTSDISAQEFWNEMFEGRTIIKEGQVDEIKIWDPEKIPAADLIIGSLLKEIRDMGLTGRELMDIANLKAPEGPAKAMFDKIIAGLTQIKLSKMKTSGQLRAFRAGQVTLKQLHHAVDLQVQESIEAFRTALKFAGDNPDDSLFRAIWETVSMSNEIHNLTDLDAWVRKKIRGGEFNGQKKIGTLTKELQGVMVNSVLSGPKTAMRAIMGTGSATFLRPLAQTLGAAMSLDGATLRVSLAEMNAMIQTIPEAWTLFKTKLNSYWSGDVATIKNRFQEYTKGDEQWEMFGHWIETSDAVTKWDRAAFYVANMARQANDNKFLTYSTKIMAATDDTFGLLLARARAKSKAMREAMNLQSQGKITDITPELLKDAENRFYGELTDIDGNITDDATIFAKKEVTLTQDLKGFSKALEHAFNSNPWAKPFFLFARTGVNGLSLTAKHTPIFNFFVEEFNDIMFADPSNLMKVKKYGIETAEDLMNAKAIAKGRLALGTSIIFMAGQHFMSGNLTGNGPADRQKRRAWIDAGYKPRTITLGGVQVGYDAFEPFNLILSTVADIGDHSQLMGEEWTEDQFQKVAVVIAQAVSSKSYLAGMQQFVDLFAGQPGSLERIIAGLMNNQIPLSSLRNEIGKVINPAMKELNSGLWQSIRNRNLMFEGLDPDGGLPNKYDLLNGKPIKDWNFPTRMFNMVSPFSINLDQGPGRKLLFESGYDMRMSTYSSPDGLDLSDNPKLRSLFQKAIGEFNLEKELDKLAKDPKIINSIAIMNKDLQNGNRANNPMQSYVHNRIIYNLFLSARKQAWAKVRNHPEAILLYQKDKRLNIQSATSLSHSKNYMNPSNKDVNNNFLLPYY